ncbi:DegV family protein [Bacillus sp. SCS-153A]|uniref:DegV family protein n=1 Tax=Rossellomorea sedimentorum TaxID=3115294 RepID=UPI003906696B
MIKIMADSTCDLSDEVLKMYDISLAPLTINIEGKIYRDRVDIQPDEFYGMMEALPDFPTTGMPSPAEYLKIIKQAVEAGIKEVLCICMSSGTSGSYQSAMIAKDYFFEESPESNVKIHVVDSKCMSHGSGWLIMKSAMMREEGASFEEIVAFNEKYKRKIKHFLSVDDLDHLIKSGRLTNASALIGKILMLKPIMTMKDGKGAIVGKERGLKRVLNHYTQEFMKRNDQELTDFIIVGYTSDIKVAENLKAKLQTETDFSGDIYIMQMGVSVGTHVGLGAISMFFVEK